MTKKGTTNWKAVLLAAIVISILIAGLLLVYHYFRPRTAEGEKVITLDVVYEDGIMESYTIHTDGEYLEQALSGADGLTIEGHRTSQMGLMIDSVNGVLADYDKTHTYWLIELDGTPCNYGVSQQPIQDGEHYRLVVTAGGM